LTNELLLVPIFLSLVFGGFLLLLFSLFGSSLVSSTGSSRAQKIPVNMGSSSSSWCQSRSLGFLRRLCHPGRSRSLT